MSVVSTLKVLLTADSTKFNKEIRNVQKQLDNVSQSFKSVGIAAGAMGGAIIAGLGAATKSFLDVGSAAVDMSARTGVSVETLTALKYAAEQSGTTMETVEKAFKTLAKNVAGNSAAFERFGINLADLKALSPDQQFLKLADSIRAIEDPTLKSAAAQKIFGKAGTQLLPLLSDGAAGVEQLMNRANELGLVLSTEAAKGAEELGDKVDELKGQFGAMIVQIGAAVAPKLRELIGYIQSVIPGVIEWIKQNDALIASVAVLGAGLVSFGTVMIPLSSAFSALSAAVGVLVPIWAGLVAAFEYAVFIVTALGAGAAALTAGVVALVAAVVAAAGYFLFFTETGQGFVKWIWDGAVAGVQYLWELMKGFGEWVGNTFGFLLEAAANIGSAAWNAFKMSISVLWDLLKEIAGWIGAGFAPIWNAFWESAKWFIEGLKTEIEALAGSLRWVLETLHIIDSEQRKGVNTGLQQPLPQGKPQAPPEAPKKPPAQQQVEAAKPVFDLQKTIKDFGFKLRGQSLANRFADQLAKNKALKEQTIAAMPPEAIMPFTGDHGPTTPTGAAEKKIGGTTAFSTSSRDFLADLARGQPDQENASNQRKEQIKILRQMNGEQRRLNEKLEIRALAKAHIGGA